MNNFILQLVAGLSKTKSKQQIKSDAKSLGDMYVKLIGNLDMPKTRKAIKAQLKGLNNLTFNITPNVNTKGVQTATKQAINNAQRVANSNKVHLNFDTNKQQLINQIKILGRNNNKLFSDQNMTAKYNQLLNSASVAKSTGELKTLRGELSAFKTELVATNNAGKTWASKTWDSIKSYAKFFSGASIIYALYNQVRNAATEAKTLDDSLVDLQKVTNEIGDRDSLYKYFDKSLSKAQELNVKVGSLIDAVTEFKKLGWDLDDAELGAKWANILSNVGDVDIDTAIGSIKTSIASFDEIGGYGNDQMDKKLEAYTDLINNMSNKHSIDAEGLAESIRLSAGTLTEAHMSIEQAATMFATANKYYNDPSYLGNTAKIGSLRMRASSGDTDAIEELQEMGEEVDDLATATSNLREKLMALTGVDIMEDEHTFKSYYDQLYEISQVMDKLDDTSRANVLETMFGKSRSAAGAAILSGMKESASAYEDAINSAGSATEEYQTWMTSADAACQRFSNTLTETYQGIINGNTVRDLANLGSAVLEFANNWGIVEGTLKGVIALGIGKFLTTGTMALITATKQVEQYGKALQMASNVPNGNLSARFQALKSIAQATSTLTTEQLRNVLATNTLTQADRVRILQMQGMTKEMALQKLAEMNLTQATNAQTAANTASTASTFSLKAAMTGLGATLKSVFLNNPVGIVLMGISLGVSAVTSAVSKHNQAVEESRQKAKEAADAANTLGDEIATLANKYIQLSDAVKTDASAKDDLMTTQTELLKKLGLEGESIDDLIAKYGSLSNAIKQASIDSLKNQQTDLIAGVNAAKEELMDVAKDNFWGTNNIISASGEEAVKAFKELEKASVIDSGSYGTGGGQLVLIGDDTVGGALENYKKLEDAVNALRDSEAFTADELSDNSLFNSIYSRYSEMKESVEAYNSSIDNLNENLAQQTMLTALQGNELPKTEEDFNKFKQELIDTAVASKQFIGNEKEITDAINNYLSTVPEFEGYYSIPLKNELDKVDELLNQDDVAQKVDDTTNADYIGKLADASKILSGLEDSYKEFKENGFVLAETISAIPEELQKLEGFDLFSKIIGDPTSGQEKIQQAFNDIVHEYLVSSETLSNLINADESTLQTYIANLKEIGVTNAEEVVTAAKTCINEENELITAAETEWLNGHIQLVNGKIKADSDYINDVNSKNTSLINALGSTYRSDYDNWTNLLAGKATAYNNFINAIKGSQINLGDGSSALSDYGKAKAIVDKWNSASFKNNSGNDPLNLSNNTRNGISKEAYEKAKAFMTYYDQYKSMTDALKIDLSNISTDFRTDYSPKIEGKKDKESKDKAKEQEKAKEQTSQTFDWIETRIDRLESKISKFQKRAEDAKRSFSSRMYNYRKEISTLFSELSTQSKAYDRYMQKANSVGLSEEWKKKVRNGAISIKDVKDDTLKEQIESYQTWYEKAKKAKDATDDLTRSIQDEYEALAKLNSEYAENKIDKYSSSIDLLEAKKENYTKYQSKNNMLSKESSYLDKELSAYQKAYRDDKTGLNSATKSINKTKTTKANKKVLKEIKSCIKSKKEISSGILDRALSVDSNLYNQCVKYNAYLAAYETDKATYDLKKQENKSKKADLAQEKMDNIDTYYSNRRQGYEQRAQELNNAIDINEAKGYQISTKYYSKLVSEEKKNNASLVEERKKLVKSLADSLKNGSVKSGSEEWYEMSKQIDDVTNAIDESTKSLVEYNNQLRQIKWDNFDYLEERIKTVTSEVDFMINELSREDLTSDNIGDFTDRGKAVAYLHASNYTSYIQQAKDYEKEVSKIEKELTKDPYNKTLISRKEELVKSYEDSISAAQDEKYAIIDLYTQGYEALKNRISDLISEYEKLMDAEKNAYDWQNTISEKTKQIADLRKQLIAYSGDVSEETRSKIQSLNVSLKDAEKDLRESEYDKLISDTKDMLSDLQDNFDDVIQDVIDSLSENFKELLDGISKTSNSAVATIKGEMNGIGYTPTDEFKEILNGTNVVTTTQNLIDTIKDFQTKMTEYANLLANSTSTTTGGQSVKDKIRSDGENTLSKAISDSNSKLSYFKGLKNNAKISRDEAKVNRDSLKKQYEDYIKTHSKNSTKAKELKSKYDIANSKYNELNKSYNVQNDIYKNMKKQNNALNYLKSHLNTTDSSRDKLSDLNKALYDKYGQRVLSETEMKELAEIVGVKFDNKNKTGNLYKKLKDLGIPGFKVGSRNIPKDMIALLGEAGNELHFSKEQGVLREVGQGDKVFTNEQAQNLWKLSQLTPVDWSKNLKLNSLNIPQADRTTTTIVEVGDIVMQGVNDVETFGKQLREEICKGGKTTKCITEAISSTQLGKGIGKAKLYK